MNLYKDLINPETKDDGCEKHGAFQSRKLPHRWTSCPQCAAEHEAASAEILREKAKAERAHQLKLDIMRAGVAERFLDRTLDSFDITTANEKAHAAAQQFAVLTAGGNNRGSSLMLVGKVGTGKTHLAVGILRAMIESGRRAAIMTTIQAIRRIKETWSRDSSETESQAMSGLINLDLLILDEVGVQFGSDTEKLILFEILNGRYERRKPTVFISNLPVPEVQTFLGERVFDRLREDGGEVVVFDWESQRGKL